MSKLRFYQAELKEVQDIRTHINLHPSITIEERIGKCPDCGGTKWWLLPKEGAAVREGGKPYCECLNCGYQTHL
jgi:DNA-directed RNA polymerase subunit M/transcription elongation factor TFIIS